jgi:AcrR family transcriptional regulator
MAATASPRRRAILDAAARLATVEGLEGLSIGRLAEHMGMSKSGLYAHFGSKEELQLAILDTAGEIFQAEVVAPAQTAATPRAALEALCESFLSHVERLVFPGGCFFASITAEFDTHPGAVRERIVESQAGWIGSLVQLVRQAQEAGELSPDEDAEQLAFELNSYLSMGNTGFVLLEDEAQLDRARAAIRSRLARAIPS